MTRPDVSRGRFDLFPEPTFRLGRWRVHVRPAPVHRLWGRWAGVWSTWYGLGPVLTVIHTNTWPRPAGPGAEA